MMVREETDFRCLESLARKIRLQVLRMVTHVGSGHIGPSFSLAEIMACLYGGVLRVNPTQPRWPDRDRLILSKGHAAPALYAALAETGFISPGTLVELRKLGSPLQGYPDRETTPGVDMTTGALGMGLSVGLGMALGLRLRQSPARVYVILGDGELNEGQMWEAAMAAVHFQVDNLIAIVDRNCMQLDGDTAVIMETEPIADKWRAFGWNVQQVDGHSVSELWSAFSVANSMRDQPAVIIARTVKGKGVSFMEHNIRFHYGLPTPQEAALAMTELLRSSR